MNERMNEQSLRVSGLRSQLGRWSEMRSRHSNSNSHSWLWMSWSVEVGVFPALCLALLGRVFPYWALHIPPASPWSFSFGPRSLGVKPGCPAHHPGRTPEGPSERPALCGRVRRKPEASDVLPALRCHRKSPSGLHSEATFVERFSLPTVTKIAPPWSRSVTSPCLGLLWEL